MMKADLLQGGSYRSVCQRVTLWAKSVVLRGSFGLATEEDDVALVGLFYLDNIAFCLLTRIVKFLLHGGIHVGQLADGQFLGIVVGQFQVSL